MPSILPLNLSKTCKGDLSSTEIDFQFEAKLSKCLAEDFDDGLSAQFTAE